MCIIHITIRAILQQHDFPRQLRATAALYRAMDPYAASSALPFRCTRPANLGDYIHS